ncbi:MAG: septum formation inhibitor Maf [Ignavibacteria bacterium]|nr:septum formation inhibitor Maf [Ignavibacteria bacterium]
MQLIKKLVLASRSPRRQSLLRQIGLQFEVRESGVDEDISVLMPPEETAKLLATQKASAVGKNLDNAIIVGADTIVVLDRDILGKPQSVEGAEEMLKKLSGRTHSVYTGFALLDRPTNQSVADVEKTQVTFRTLSSEEIHDYVRSGSPMDKAGAYGIQDDYGAVFVEKIEGCFYNVVGFPLARFYTAMENFQKHLMGK